MVRYLSLVLTWQETVQIVLDGGPYGRAKQIFLVKKRLQQRKKYLTSSLDLYVNYTFSEVS